ncbi:MAG: AAA family ATPase [Rhizomicrobium sp.]
MQIIIITGTAATGKTSIAREVAERLRYKLLSKDSIKEHLFMTDSKRPGLKNWKYYESKSLELLYENVRNSIETNTPTIVESNFHRAEVKKIAEILTVVPCKEIYCKSNGWVRLYRSIRRKEKLGRHVGHIDRFWYPAMFLAAVIPPLARLDNPEFKFIKKRLTVNTTHFSEINLEQIIDFVIHG